MSQVYLPHPTHTTRVHPSALYACQEHPNAVVCIDCGICQYSPSMNHPCKAVMS